MAVVGSGVIAERRGPIPMEPDGSVAVVHGGVAVTVGSEVIGERRGLGEMKGLLAVDQSDHDRDGPVQDGVLADLTGSVVVGGQTASTETGGMVVVQGDLMKWLPDKMPGAGRMPSSHLPGPAQVPALAFLADLAGSEAVFGGQTWSMKKDGVVVVEGDRTSWLPVKPPGVGRARPKAAAAPIVLCCRASAVSVSCCQHDLCELSVLPSCARAAGSGSPSCGALSAVAVR